MEVSRFGRKIAETSGIGQLMDDLGINLAGAEIILRMAQRMAELQHHIEGLESEIKRLKQKKHQT